MPYYIVPLDFSTECPPGQVLNQCGAYCQETCEQRVSGEQFSCIEICGPPACVCPDGLLLFRDRCVDPRLCYALVTCEYHVVDIFLMGRYKRTLSCQFMLYTNLYLEKYVLQLMHTVARKYLRYSVPLSRNIMSWPGP